MNRRPIAVTGLGIVSAAGDSPAAVWQSLAAHRSGLGRLTLFDSPRFGDIKVGQVDRDFGRDGEYANRSRSIRLAMHAARQACDAANVQSLDAGTLAQMGVSIGACTGGMFESETFLDRVLTDHTFEVDRLHDHALASATNVIADQYGAGGARMTLSTACSSGAMAIAGGCDLIQSGQAKVVIAGGVDSLTRLTLNGFCSLLVVDGDGCRPFDAERRGMSLGEAAGIVVLEDYRHATERGAEIAAVVSGWAATCDAHHATAPDPDGQGIMRAMAQAMAIAGRTPGEIDYINAHGTGTIDNDAAEGKAIARLFEGRLPLVSSTKHAFGHTLAAAGAVEAIVCILALQNQQAPANLGLTRVAEGLGFEPAREMAAAKLQAAVSNSMGFGGNNCSLVIERHGGEAAGDAQTISAMPVDILGAGFVSPQGNKAALELPQGSRTKELTVLTCETIRKIDVVAAGKLRRLGHAQRMALAAAAEAMGEVEASDMERWAVSVGTGLGTINDTAAFLANCIEKQEREPMPAKFTNSVHNAIASQLAIAFGLKGENHTFCHDTISFENAVEHGARLLSQGRAQAVLACGVDELNAYVLAAELERNRLEADGKVQAGEGAGALLLGKAEAGERVARIANMATFSLKRLEGTDEGVAEVVGQIEEVVTSGGGTLNDVACVLSGVNGDRRLERYDQMIYQAIAGQCDARPVWGTYKQACGEYCSASAIGLALAAKSIELGRLHELIEVAEGEGRGLTIHNMLILHLTMPGYLTVAWMTP